jgi:hypothetical protein
MMTVAMVVTKDLHINGFMTMVVFQTKPAQFIEQEDTITESLALIWLHA